MSTLFNAKDMRAHSENSPTAVMMPIAATVLSQLQDIKEEEDVELTRLDSNDSCLSKHRVSRTSSLSSVMRHNLNSGTSNGKDGNHDANKDTDLTAVAGLSDAKLSPGGKTASVDDLSLLPPLPNTIENVLSAQPALEPRAELDGMIGDIPMSSVDPKTAVDFHSAAQTHTGDIGSDNITASNFKQIDKHKDFMATIENDSGVIETLGAPFDLSKALEIPASFSNSAIHNQGSNHTVTGISTVSTTNISANNSDSSHSVSSTVTTPKVPSSKKKTPTSLLNSDSNNIVSQESSPIEISLFGDSKPHGLRSKSNSNAASFQHLLQNFSMGLDTASIESNANDNLNYFSSRMSNDKRSTRKVSTDNSSNSSFSNTSISDELLYKMPPPKLHRISNSRSRSNSNSNLVSSTLSLEGLNHGSSTATSVLNTPTNVNTFFPRDANKNMKKVPLLRRASTAILRKTSIKNNATCFEKEYHRSRSASTTPILPNSPFFDAESIKRTPPLNQQKYCSSFVDNDDSIGYFPSCSNDIDENDLHYVTQLNDASRPPSRNPSIRSRMRKGISRIISTGGTVKRAVSSSSLKTDIQTLDGNEHNNLRDRGLDLSSNQLTALSSPLENFLIENRSSPGKKSATFQLIGDNIVDVSRSNSSSTKHNSPRSKDPLTNVTPVSTSTMMSPPASNLMQTSGSSDKRETNLMGDSSNGFDAQNGSLMTLTDTKHGLGVKGRTKKLQMGGNTNEYDVTVDLDKLTKSIPVITVTGKINSRSCVAIQDQSNIGLDAVYMGRGKKISDQFYSGNKSNSDNDTDKPEMMTLKEYVGILMKQQQIEDERLAILEKNFIDSGWCSKDDIRAIKQKRVIISKKWAERISFYQSKLDF